MEFLRSSLEYAPGIVWLSPVLLIVASGAVWTSWRHFVAVLGVAARWSCSISFVIIMGSTLQLFGSLSPVPFEAKAVEGLGRAGIALVLYFCGDLFLQISAAARRSLALRRSLERAARIESDSSAHGQSPKA